MVYLMEVYVDGTCRGHAQSRTVGAAAAVLQTRGDTHYYRTRKLPFSQLPRPSNQRSEMTGILLGLQWGLERAAELRNRPRMDLRIYSDSRYAVTVMTHLVYKWMENHWRNANDAEIANRDLIQTAVGMDQELKKMGTVSYIWISKSENVKAIVYCNRALNELPQP
ncbi:ribonuclease H1 [Xylariaceae sp. FL0662B]|nr:ribonuclease H1 [Xylariaceae sp. FL0662B]